MKSRAVALLVGVLTALCGIAVYRSQPAAAAVAEAGRYQLVPARYHINTESTSLDGYGLFKIDTATGETWIYREGSGGQRAFWSEWRRINDQRQ